MGRPFVHDQLIRFAHCDPAGIVYFPRFFDLAHSTMEDWFAQGLGLPLPDMIRDRRIGSPTVSIGAEFVRPLRMGETLRFELTATQVGRSSVGLRYRGTREGALHLSLAQTIVFMDLDAVKAVPVPEDLRPRIESFLVEAEEPAR